MRTPPDELAPPEGFFARLKRWYSDDRIFFGVAFLLAGLAGALLLVLSWLAYVLLGGAGLLWQVALVGAFTFCSFVAGVGLLLRQGWVRSIALGVLVAYVLYTLAKLVYVPGYDVTIGRVGLFLFGAYGVYAIPRMPVTRAEEEAERAAEESDRLVGDVIASLRAYAERLEEAPTDPEPEDPA